MLEIKIASGLEKPFIDSSLDDYTKLTSISALKGERITFEIIYRLIDDGDGLFLKRLRPTLYGGLAKYATLKNICRLHSDPTESTAIRFTRSVHR